MECSVMVDGGAEFLRRFRSKAVEECIPLNGAISLTHRCNLKCSICYSRADSRRAPELDAAGFARIIGECADAGCLSLLISGGEPLLRDDFAAIYTAARNSGMFVTVFTNATLVDGTTTDLFRDVPPNSVEVSLYGATADAYESITGVRGSFAKCIAGIERLLAAGVQIKLKTMLVKQNLHELPRMEAMAESYGVSFRYDVSIFPRLDGDRSPLSSRVSPDDAATADFADTGKSSEWLRLFNRYKDVSSSDRTYTCGAGITAFHVDPYGMLQPCVITPGMRYDLGLGSFSAGWKHLSEQVAAKRNPPDYMCATCNKKILCGYCPGLFALETGRETGQSDFICELGHRRFERIERLVGAV